MEELQHFGIIERLRVAANMINQKILPIAKWLLRLMLWKTGEGENYFKNVVKDQSYSYEHDHSSDSDDDI